ncbi:FAD-dependent oxidoreductase, partial [Cellulomonas hominis]|nr:FAD-dependent oxidoreductase [Cellulomonas hominis]
MVVVGAGLAGARTVLELRAQGFTGRVTVLGAEPVAPYDRPPLSKHLLDRPAPAWLADELGADALALADEVRLGTPATGLDLAGPGVVVRTADGTVAA